MRRSERAPQVAAGQRDSRKHADLAQRDAGLTEAATYDLSSQSKIILRLGTNKSVNHSSRRSVS